VLSERAAINTFVTALEEIIRAKPAKDQIVGLDAEWNVLTERHGMQRKMGKLALLILAYKDNEGSLQTTLLRLHKFTVLPHRLLQFLVGETKFVGNCVWGHSKTRT